MLRLPILILLATLSLLANSNIVGSTWIKEVRDQVKKDMLTLTDGEFQNKYSDNFQLLDELVLAEWYDDLNFTKTQTQEQIQAMFQNRDREALKELFTCPQPNKAPGVAQENFNSAIIGAKLYTADYIGGTFKCFLHDERYPIGIFDVKIENWNNVMDLDLAASESQNFSKIVDAKFLAKDLDIAQLSASASLSGYLNKTDIMLNSILGNEEVIDLEATKATSSIVLKPEYNSLYLKDTTTVVANASEVSWEQTKGFMSSVGWIFNRATGVETPVRITKKLDKMSLIIQDQTNLLANTNAGIITMVTAFSDVSGLYYYALAGVALMFGLGLWAYNGIENPSGKLKLNKGYPIALIFSITMLMPYGDDFKSNFQRAEINAYSTANEYANNLSLAFINASFVNLQNQLGMHAKDQIIQSGARLKQEGDKTWIHANMIHRCRTEGSEDFKKYGSDFRLKSAEKNIFGSPQETQNLLAFPRVYNPRNKGGMFDAVPTSTISFCSKSYEDYYKAAAMYDKFEKVLESNANLEASQMANLVTLQYGLQRDWGWVSVLAMPVIKYRLENAGKLPAQSEVKTDDEEELIQQFANSAILYLVPGAEKIKNLAADFLSPLENIPYVGGLLAGAGGALISVLFMDKLLGILPVLAIMVFGAFRVVIILMKIFIFHLFTPFLMIAVIMGKQGKEAVFKYSSYIFATMLEMPIFVFGVYALIVMQDYLNGIGKSLGQALNAIYLQTGKDLSAFDMLNNIDYYILGALLDVSLRILTLVLIYRVIFTLHEMVLNAIQTQSENTLEKVAETAVQSSSRWSAKV